MDRVYPKTLAYIKIEGVMRVKQMLGDNDMEKPCSFITLQFRSYGILVK